MARRKQKSKLAKLMESKEDNVYETTYEDCLIWFEILNKELFENKLKPIDEVDIRWRRGAFAYYELISDRETNEYISSKLCMNKRYSSMKFFVEVLSHELVHHFQALHNEPVGHGPSFTRWCEKFNKKGLKLYKAYG